MWRIIIINVLTVPKMLEDHNMSRFSYHSNGRVCLCVYVCVWLNSPNSHSILFTIIVLIPN